MSYSTEQARKVIEQMTKRIKDHSEKTGKPISEESARKVAVSDQIKIDKEKKK